MASSSGTQERDFITEHVTEEENARMVVYVLGIIANVAEYKTQIAKRISQQMKS